MSNKNDMVTVSFSVTTDELPARLCSMLDDAQRLAKAIPASIEDTCDPIRDGALTNALDRLIEIKDTITQLDIRLQDCMQIVFDYRQYLASPPANEDHALGALPRIDEKSMQNPKVRDYVNSTPAGAASNMPLPNLADLTSLMSQYGSMMAKPENHQHAPESSDKEGDDSNGVK